MKSTTRPYRMVERAEAAAATRARILACAEQLTRETSYDALTLEAVAACAGVSARTVLRAFGSKEQLFAATLEAMGFTISPAARPGDTDGLLRELYGFYENYGDMIIRWLADEPRLPDLRDHLEEGRRGLRAAVADTFAPQLARFGEAERAEALNALILAMDIYGWKLLRRDFGQSRAAAEGVVRRLVAGLVEGD